MTAADRTPPYADRIGETVDPPAFSNGTEWEMWSANYCDRCWHDRKQDCELIALGFAHLEVPQWVYTDRFWPAHVHCIKFTPTDEGPDEGPPTPRPVPPGQTVLIDPSEYDWDRPTVERVEVSP